MARNFRVYAFVSLQLHIAPLVKQQKRRLSFMANFFISCSNSDGPGFGFGGTSVAAYGVNRLPAGKKKNGGQYILSRYIPKEWCFE